MFLPRLQSLTELHVKHIKGKFGELGIKSASGISRIFYFVPAGKRIAVLHGFVKKQQKTQNKEN
ncbi:MAG: type II toxin-antitoxin system RelE/ParE family toxin [Clostridiales bacterium]|nr:type II toxin-antitoxin system RelE/ParE family toxin [Clostridiales bacterium]